MKYSLPISRPPAPARLSVRGGGEPGAPPAQRGVALVITLVLLSIITFMAVTFLVVSRSQHGAVAMETDQVVARLAADSARERAIAELVAPILAGNNEFNYGLLVSTNYISSAGFVSGNVYPTNVNYAYPNGTPLKSGPPAYDFEQNLANLLYNPRPPVFVTNWSVANSNEFRFYLDLNRNGLYDTNGLQPVIGMNREMFKDPVSGLVLSNFYVGDPEWIGGLRRPENTHSADNPFIYRYAYIAVPAGQTLDLNYIHNQARNTKGKLNLAGSDFLRNQGVSTFEINLAAFLHDLNTNLWSAGYVYDPINGFWGGTAFQDAVSLLAYRYAMNPNQSFTLASVSQLFGTPGVNAFGRDFLDGYSGGPAMPGTWWPQTGALDSDSTRVASSWAGADNPNRFYSTQDLFDKTKTALGAGAKVLTFTDRLLTAGTNVSSYDRYTFYRLLSQLGTDSAPEPGSKINLNYCNVDASGYVVPNMATNFTPWQSTNFFTNAAIRLLADAGYTVGLPGSTSNVLVYGSNYVNGLLIATTNLSIPIWPTNFYSASVHRILQLALNIYDATTNRTDLTKYPYLPTVLRPIFSSTGGGKGGAGPVCITSYREVTPADTDLLNPATPPLDLSDPTVPPSGKVNLVCGIPLVIGAKKGLPNFNEFAMHSHVQVTRKLQFHRPGASTTAPVNEIDQMYIVGISNSLGVEAWNSYAASYPRRLQIVALPDITVLVTNLETRKLLRYSRWQPQTITTNIPANQWSGYNNSFPQGSFQVPVHTNLVFLSNMIYSVAGDVFVPLPGRFERNVGSTNFHLPLWKLKLKTRLRFAVIDNDAGRIVDYVNLASDSDLDITAALATGAACGATYTTDTSTGGMWCTNRANNATGDNIPTYGIRNQIEASLGHATDDNWNSSTKEFPTGMDKAAAIAFFKGQFVPNYLRSSNTFNAPFQPFRDIYLVTTWQANDPLVHYTIGDLTDLVHTNLMVDTLTPSPTANLGAINGRYEPWGGNPDGKSQSATIVDPTVKDPLMLRSDNWDFPTNKFPNVGWLGRIHRGTPWQTVYLKSLSFDTYANWFGRWQKWSGNGQTVANVGQLTPTLVGFNNIAPDAFFTQPTNDWHLLDLFTTTLNDNATRGQLSVNQTNLAAWSALLSGVLVLTNNLDASGTPIRDIYGNLVPAALPIQPAGYYDPADPTTWPALVRLFNGINVARYNSPRHVFSRLSDILAVPELTMASPFLSTNNTFTFDNAGLNDSAYERLPQQIAGLLKADSAPRFVIYSFGQTLKPESTRAIVKNGPFAGLCTNYQIVAEAATRTVVRLDGVQPNRGAYPSAITNLHPVIESYNVLAPD